MSYDYSLFRAPGPGPMATWAPVSPAPLGTLEEVTQRLAAIFPAVSWERSGQTWFGRSRPSTDGGVELQVSPDEDGLCRFLTVRRVGRRELEALCRALDVVAVDVQRMELIRP